MDKMNIDIICGRFAEVVSPVIKRINQRKKSELAKASGLRNEDISGFLKSPEVFRKILENIQSVPVWERPNKKGN